MSSPPPSAAVSVTAGLAAASVVPVPEGFISITRSWSAVKSVPVVTASVMRATAASLRPSAGAGTATVTPSPDMYTTQSEKSFAISVFSSCVSSIDQFAIAAIAFIALSIVSCDALSALAAVCKSPSASSREVWRVSRAWAK